MRHPRVNEEKVLKKKGMVYIIKNPAFEGWCKIGQTTTSVEKRLKGYQTGSPFRDYHCIFSIECKHVTLLEVRVHHLLLDEGYLNNGEWFKIEDEVAIDTIISLHKLI